MYGVPCATALVLFAAWPREAAAMYHGPGKRDGIHRIYKVEVLTETVELGKRAADSCPTSYSICATSLGGGCCPDNYDCATDACYATTAGTSTCQGQVGYYGCGIDTGAGCCPQGMICATGQSCTAPVGVTFSSQTCPTGYFLCPSAFDYGCCKTGMGCATDACYSTAPSTIVNTYTTTQDEAVATITSTTVTTPTAPTAIPSDTNIAVPKYIPSTVSKVHATSTASPESNGGLTTPELGGVIGGAVVLLIAVLLASFFIIKRLKHTEQVVIEQRESTSGTGTRRTTDKKSTTQVSVRQVLPTPSEIDRMDYDPLIMPSGTRTSRYTTSRNGSDISGPTSNMSSHANFRAPSVDSELEGSYFDLPMRVHDYASRKAARVSADTHMTSQYHQHGRHWSNASELSANSDGVSSHGVGSPFIPELDTEGGIIPELPGSDTGGNRKRSNRTSGISGISEVSGISSIASPMSTVVMNRPPLAHQRKRSDPNNNVRGRGDSNATSIQQLGVVEESSEILHGHYGSPVVAAGQTNMGLDIMQDISSPMRSNFASDDDNSKDNDGNQNEINDSK